MKTTRRPTFVNTSAGRQNLIATALVCALAVTAAYAQTTPKTTTDISAATINEQDAYDIGVEAYTYPPSGLRWR